MCFRVITLAATLAAGTLVPLIAGQPASAAPPVLCAPPGGDTLDPVATSVTFGRHSINLDSGSRSQRVTVRASDTSGSGPASGVASVRISLDPVGYAPTDLALVSGTPTSGVWRGSFRVSKFAKPGTRAIAELDVTDKTGNATVYTGAQEGLHSPYALSLHPADDPTFTVKGTPAVRPATRAGTLRSFSVSRTRVNTTRLSRLVRFRVRFHKTSPRKVTVGVRSVEYSWHGFVGLNAVLHKQHGTWTGRVRVPRWLGRQRLRIRLVADYPAGTHPRYRIYSRARLADRHFDSMITVVSGAVDRTPPRLTSLSVAPVHVDSTKAAAHVTVTATATDHGSGSGSHSGVTSIVVEANIYHGVNGVPTGLYLHPGVGYDAQNSFLVELHRTAKGTWVGTATVPQCVPSGTYKLSAEVRDGAQNLRSYSSSKLAGSHLTSTVDVTSRRGDVKAPYVVSGTSDAADHTVRLTFDEGVSHVSTSTLTLFPLSPRSARFRSTTSIASIVCRNPTGVVDCSGSAGLVTSAVLSVPGLDRKRNYDVFANLNQVYPQLVDGNGNTMDDSYASAEIDGS